jgi:WD40 repeat protein
MKGHEGGVRDASFSSDARFAVSASDDRTIRVWDLETGKCLQVFNGHGKSVTCVQFTPDRRFVLSGSEDKTLRLWELTSGRCLRVLEGHFNDILCAHLDPTGKYAVCGGWGKTVQLWNLATGKLVHPLLVPSEKATIINAVCFTYDSQMVVSGAENGFIYHWRLSDGSLLRQFVVDSKNINCLHISLDGQCFITAVGNTAQLLDSCTGNSFRCIEGHDDEVKSVVISNDGRWLISGSWDQTVRCWELDWDYEFPAPMDWDEGAKSHLNNFLTLNSPNAGMFPKDREPSEDEIQLAFTRRGKPVWNDEDFKKLITELQYRGYGWLRPEGVRKKLEEMTANWQGPPPLPWEKRSDE